MTDHATKAEKLAQNAVLTLIARAAMGVCALLIVPAVIAIFQMSASIERLTFSNREMKAELAARIDQAEARINLRLGPLESRQDTQSARLRDQDAKLDALTDKLTQITVQVAVLVERINALLAANQPNRPAGTPR
jgi:uncharacterized coiled-coil protein SlyX